jgi:hypothetical protein
VNPVHIIDPVTDPRWSALVARHPAASVFHTPGWLDALRRTYGFEPFAVTASAGPALAGGVVLCRVRGWGSRRLVSLPFSDHCAPLLQELEELRDVLSFLEREVDGGRWRSAELRLPGPLRAPVAHRFLPERRWCLHTLDLTPPAQRIFKSFHPSSTQRAIRRAEREGVIREAGTSERLLASFYGLLRMARRRHGVPPQPLAWFRNLVACLGDRARVHLASKDGRPIASLLTLSFGKTLVYKYGGSDAAHHPLGGMPLLFWRAIEEARAAGLEVLDLGRSDFDQPGLIAFKDHLGARRSAVNAYTHPQRAGRVAQDGLLSRAARGVFAHLPNPALDLAGRLLYRHLG